MTKNEWRKLMLRHVSLKTCVCYLCGKMIEKQKDFSLDHVVPKSRGGADDESNWKPAHKNTCNSRKGALTYEEYVEWARLESLRTGHTR